MISKQAFSFTLKFALKVYPLRPGLGVGGIGGGGEGGEKGGGEGGGERYVDIFHF